MSFENEFIVINFFLFCASVILSIILSITTFIVFYKKRASDLEDTDKKNVISWVVFYLILAIQLSLMVLWKFWITDLFLNNILERISNTAFFLATFIKVIDIEKSINKLEHYKGYFFSILLCIIMIMNIFIDPTVLKTIGPIQIIFIIIIFTGFAIFPIIYFYVAIKSTGDIRLNALLVSAGAVFLGLGYLFRPANLMAYRAIPILDMLINYLYITSPVSIMLGLILIFLSMRNK